jgi:AAA family ATP:ADP antiporter
MRLVARSPLLRMIAAQTLILTILQTILYFLQADILGSRVPDSDTRTSLLATMDLAVNAIVIPTQAFLTGRSLRWLGVGVTLAIAPLCTVLGLGALAAMPAVSVLVAAQIARRATHYAVERPARETLFAPMEHEEKYKAKNFLDTVVYRGGDMVSGWGYMAIAAAGIGTAAVGAPIALAGVVVALAIGARSRLMDRERSEA